MNRLRESKADLNVGTVVKTDWQNIRAVIEGGCSCITAAYPLQKSRTLNPNDPQVIHGLSDVHGVLVARKINVRS